MHRKTLTRTFSIALGAALGLNMMTGTAFAAAPASTVGSTDAAVVTSPPDSEHEKFQCSDSHHSNTGHGANNDDGYQSTCDETDFGGNGQEFGPGQQTGKPCAGCVGNADDKNPPGQFPDGSDANSGYECDGRDRKMVGQNGNGNHGIGDENPAHTGCTPTVVTEEPPAPTCPDKSAMPTTDVNLDGAIDIDDCDEPELCPNTGEPMTDTNKDGHVNAADCNKVDDEDETPELCPNSDLPMTDTNDDGHVNAADCDKKKVDDVDEPKQETCPNGEPMTDDVDGNGIINAADCNKVEDTVIVKVPEVTTQVVVPEVVVPVVEVAAQQLVAPPAVQLEQFVVAPAAPGRPTQVLGVQVERANLARTGLTTDVLVLLAGALLFVGALLVRTGHPAKR